MLQSAPVAAAAASAARAAVAALCTPLAAATTFHNSKLQPKQSYAGCVDVTV